MPMKLYPPHIVIVHAVASGGIVEIVVCNVVMTHWGIGNRRSSQHDTGHSTTSTGRRSAAALTHRVRNARVHGHPRHWRGRPHLGLLSLILKPNLNGPRFDPQHAGQTVPQFRGGK